MIVGTLDLIFGIGKSTNALLNGKTDQSRNSSVELFEGDTQNIRVYLRRESDDGLVNAQLGTNESLVIAITQRNSLNEQSVPILCYSETFEQGIDSDGDTYYEGIIELNTQELTTAIAEQSSINCVIEAVIVDTQLGRQFTLQGRVDINKSIVPSTALTELSTPSLNIGSFATVEALIESMVDSRILGLKDGAPVEFDTLYELAEAAMGMQSLRAEIGNFQDYLDGKELADSGLTITQLGQIQNGNAPVTVTT